MATTRRDRRRPNFRTFAVTSSHSRLLSLLLPNPSLHTNMYMMYITYTCKAGCKALLLIAVRPFLKGFYCPIPIKKSRTRTRTATPDNSVTKAVSYGCKTCRLCRSCRFHQTGFSVVYTIYIVAVFFISYGNVDHVDHVDVSQGATLVLRN